MVLFLKLCSIVCINNVCFPSPKVHNFFILIYLVHDLYRYGFTAISKILLEAVETFSQPSNGQKLTFPKNSLSADTWFSRSRRIFFTSSVCRTYGLAKIPCRIRFESYTYHLRLYGICMANSRAGKWICERNVGFFYVVSVTKPYDYAKLWLNVGEGGTYVCQYCCKRVT